jgi:Hemerythrin HHE cation binding domain
MPMSATQSDAIALLKADHRKVEELFEKFEAALGADKKQNLVKQICTELTVHTIIEEEIFYPSCRGHMSDDLLDETFGEHDSAKVMLAELEAGAPDEEFYDAKVKVLSEQIDHHVEEEEKPSEGIFAKARAAKLELTALGANLMARKEELAAQLKARGLPPPETHTFTEHELDNAATKA